MLNRTKSCLSIVIEFVIVFTILITLMPVDFCKAEENRSTVVVVHSNNYFPNPSRGETDVYLLPLRKVLEPMGVVVKWDVEPVQSSPSITVFSLTIGSEEVTRNRGRADNKIFFLEQAPVIINGQTLVPYGFIREVARNTANSEQSQKMLAATIAGVQQNNIEKTSQEYKYYDLLMGDPYGPSLEKAQEYVIQEGLLKTIKQMSYTPIRNDTMVAGNDENGCEKIVWLGFNPYTGEIYITGRAYPEQGLKLEDLYEKLILKGISKKNILTATVLPHKSGAICWYVEADINNNKTILFYNFYNGQLIEEWVNGAIVK